MPFIRVIDVPEQAQATDDNGNTYTNFSAEDEAGNTVYCRLGWKTASKCPAPGMEIEIQPVPGGLSPMPNQTTHVRRAQAAGGNPYGGGNRGGGQRTSQPAQARSGAANASQAPSHAPTVAEHLALMSKLIPRCGAFFERLYPELPQTAVVDNARALAISIAIGLERGSIKADPTQAEVEAAAAAKAKLVEDAKRLLAEQAQETIKQASPGGYMPAAPADDGDISF